MIPALERLRQEDLQFEASVGYTMILCLKTKERKEKK
jgi:hypothetical protein